MNSMRIWSLIVVSSLCGCLDETWGDAEPTGGGIPDRSVLADPDVVVSASEFANRSSEFPFRFEVPCPSTLAIPTDVQVHRPIDQEIQVRVKATVPRNVTGEWAWVDLMDGSQQVVLNLTVSTYEEEPIFLVFDVEPNVKGLVVHAFGIECF